MFDDGYERIDNIDISEVVINQMKARNSSRKSMTYTAMDAKDLHFTDNSYDLVFDKCMLDSILCGDKAFYQASLVTKVLTRHQFTVNRKYNECLRLTAIIWLCRMGNQKTASCIFSVTISRLIQRNVLLGMRKRTRRTICTYARSALMRRIGTRSIGGELRRN
eukprot:TRINITY_DN1016_c0_g1_i2.p2 TRINITY_DN1016_c0_g1~~TRINITY_DN1016_c0_g1_i2.p2  ORF type:complete len:163 (-),score=3.42 TRINITY_DN1016_c0_g1_i2:206-694(-)